ncbi:DUF4175 domain-containing protein [Donghicola tyrosinivorans]|uniref:Uncharacterized protein (TIGR02302 family) n=1 Tax=Donghicola tyrosinivorans TaxID=1652492 RepID=A0A2T0X022_9RHOB|nr:DUF4175 domain-containing protein [Donghicola tyrosinivorans]PRY92289.1 uncharacterized protein (TIGR02302 family) [Donghicola tyrosinivorans]
MAELSKLPQNIRTPLFLTWLGLWAERGVRAFWPLWSVLFVLAAAVLFNGFSLFDGLALWLLVGFFAGAFVVTAWQGQRQFIAPSRSDALRRLDATLPGRPLAALLDTPAVGRGDASAEAMWRTHLQMMAQRARLARAVPPELSQRQRDPYALRYVAAVALGMALLFGSFGMGRGPEGTPDGAALASGPAWEGWLEPPRHTRLPALYLNDIPEGALDVVQGSRLTLRVYGAEGVDVRETVSGTPVDETQIAAMRKDFTVRQAGEVEVTGTDGRIWQIALRPDQVPTISHDGEIETTPEGEMTLPFWAEDDYGIVSGTAEIALDLPNVNRRYGLTPDPEPRDIVRVDLPMSFSGNRQAFGEILREDFSQHPWAGLPVTISLSVTDAQGQVGKSAPISVPLPGRSFFDPMAKAVIEARRDLLWNRTNGARVDQVLRAVTWLPEEVFRDMDNFTELQAIQVRLQEGIATGGLTSEARDELAEALWALALALEDGDLENALERLRQAQERLSEAMRNGASPDEIARLMEELRQATQDYMRELAERNGDENDPDAQRSGEATELTQDDLQAMMDRIQRLMNEGRMAEAQQLLDELMQMMENMQVTQGQGGQGQQALDQLGDTLREQQDLSDDSFNELNQRQNGQGGQPEEGEGQGQGDLADQLAQRQQALRDELQRQEGNLPGAGTDEGEAARQSLRDAGRAMDEAAEALRDDNLGRAIDRQAEAIERLREGMRSLNEALNQQDGQQQAGGQQGQGRPAEDGRQDPLGRREGNGAPLGSDNDMLQGEDAYRRAEELTDEIRRRSSEAERPEEERDYLNRLLDRF